MPRENRKRGKKHKKALVDEIHQDLEEQLVESHAGPSWIVPAAPGVEDVNSEYPFGYVDPDVKAYFKTVDQRLREWQESRAGVEIEDIGDVDPNEDRRLFLVAALTETSGKEKQLATDPECSNILERMVYSMDDFVKRVFMDRISGSYEQLSKHRFASHVLQTLFDVAGGTVIREAQGIFPPRPDSSPKDGELPTLTQLVKNACSELLPSSTSAIMDPFASHVLRAIFLLLCPSISSPVHESSSHRTSASALRSKKSAKYRAKLGPMKSILPDDKEAADPMASKVMPPGFDSLAGTFVEKVRKDLNENEVRALAADRVACPVLLLLLQLEAHYKMSDESGSLVDSVSVGLIAACNETPPVVPPPSDYLVTLLREPIASHLLETLISLLPPFAFGILWEQYFQGKLNKFAVHPVANFVVARAIERINGQQLLTAITELEGSWPKLIKNARTGVLRASIDRAVALNFGEKEVMETVHAAFGVADPGVRNLLVPCVLALKPYEGETISADGNATNDGVNEEASKRIDHTPKGPNASMEPTIQGAVVLQSMLRVSEPYNHSVIDSIQSLSTPELLAMSHHASSSRVLDVLLESSSVPPKTKRKFVLSLLGNYHLLVDDRIGSRVADRCWASADPYLKEKIARSLIPHENFLVASFYGKFFARNLHLHLLQRRPEDWKALQTGGGNRRGVVGNQASSTVTVSTDNKPNSIPDALHGPVEPKKRKREQMPDNEIDALFNERLGKKIQRGNLGSTTVGEEETSAGAEAISPKSRLKEVKTSAQGLETVLGAIRAAPKDTQKFGKKRGH